MSVIARGTVAVHCDDVIHYMGDGTSIIGTNEADFSSPFVKVKRNAVDTPVDLKGRSKPNEEINPLEIVPFGEDGI